MSKRKVRKQTGVLALVRPYLRAQRSRLVRMSCAAILGGFAEAGLLVLVARIALALASDDAAIKVDIGPLGSKQVATSSLLAIAAGLVVVRVAFQAVQVVLSARATVATVNRTRKDLIGLYLAASWPLQASQREGRLQELLTSYAGATAAALNAVSSGAVAGFSLTALLVTALAVNAIASVAAAAAALLIGLSLRPLRAAARRRSSRAANAQLLFATGLTELTSTLQEVRIFEVEGAVGGRLDGLSDQAAARSLQTSYVSGSIGALYQGVALMLIVGALAVSYAAGFTEIGSLGAIVLIMLRSLSYAQGVQSAVQALYEAAPYVETLEAEKAEYRAAAVTRGGRSLEGIEDIAFEDVTFEYHAGQPVLTDVSFRVRAGEVIGIVGPSGAGKSTLVQLLLRLREPSAGRVCVNGMDASSVALDDWYGSVTFVPQEARLFAGSVAENIRFFRPDVEFSSIERASKLAHLHDDIVAWPLGYDTPVGERGGQISGGQRQRLCIARALVDEPDIVVLDEPTASLDVRSESLIRETLQKLGETTTVFVIAHRLSTLAICDRIMVIIGGRLEGFDAPVELEAHNPFYQEALRLSGMR